MDLTIAHMVLVHERIALCLDTLVTARVLIVVIIGRPCTHFEPRHLDGPRFLHCGSCSTRSNGEVLKTIKTFSGHMVKCWIPKIYLTDPSTESSTSSRPL
jgi:hypothetical protein